MHHEIEALRDNLLANTEIRYISLKQIGGLNGLIRQGLEEKTRDMRILVLREWAGDAMWAIERQVINSTKNLTSPIASFLINLLKEDDSTPWRLSDYGQRLISITEKAVKESSLQKSY